jgi:hypothetical protein
MSNDPTFDKLIDLIVRLTNERDQLREDVRKLSIELMHAVRREAAPPAAPEPVEPVKRGRKPKADISDLSQPFGGPYRSIDDSGVNPGEKP